MDNTLLVSLSQQLAAYRSMEVIANNLANLSTPAYKREEVKFQQYIQTGQPADGQTGRQTVSFVKDTGIVRDLSEGHLQTTNAPFDLAISGKGYFVVQTAAGNRYTRDGHLTLNGDGQLVNGSGDPILGDGGPVTITADDGDIHIASDGTVSGKQGEISKLQLVNFADERAMQKEGASLYSTSQSPIAVEKPYILQGALETSNVEPVIEISHMIEVMRAYQATATLAQSESTLKQKAIDQLGSVPN
ncbi:MAG: flagellar basal-body rod protein FlgF [Alphaproteobacteria bacterium]|nr:flagellar basal-body rod protein FlgF [Alphaproteobacteria bacterium]MDE2109813.1 flagellar basal-body rod protein FlgF [Alphaproteobacteria bacterium]MDE2495842.1 flagellar basal-body rod protein FlgF [Alphaproteobacteria bacterium]